MRCGIVLLGCTGCSFATWSTSDKNMHHAWVSHDIILNVHPSFSKSARVDASCGASNQGLDAGVFGGLSFRVDKLSFTRIAKVCSFLQTKKERATCGRFGRRGCSEPKSCRGHGSPIFVPCHIGLPVSLWTYWIYFFPTAPSSESER